MSKIELISIKRTVVSIPIERRFRILMKLYEDAGWTCIDGVTPATSLFKYWTEETNSICVSVGFNDSIKARNYEVEGFFLLGTLGFYRKKGFNIITLGGFCDAQAGIPDDIREKLWILIFDLIIA